MMSHQFNFRLWILVGLIIFLAACGTTKKVEDQPTQPQLTSSGLLKEDLPNALVQGLLKAKQLSFQF